MQINYTASPTITRFHQSEAFHRLIMGPVRSGKSVGNTNEIFRRAQEQVPGPDGIRHTRWAVIRSTYRMLLDTTLKTWLDWWREEYFGRFNYNTMTHRIRYRDVDAEVMFRALDVPQDVAKLLSLELTGAWVNEARDTPKGIIDALGDRVGQFPALKDGGCTWRGVMLDTNMPDTDHWIYKLAEEDRPDGWDVFKQPGGLIEINGKFYENPEAENITNLEPHYYLTRMHGKSLEHTRVYYCAQYGFVMDGKPVIPEFVDATHVSKEILTPVTGVPMYVGLDFGLFPAALFAQRLANGMIIWVDELVTEDMGAVSFGKELKAKLLRDFRPWLENGTLRITGDPAGEQRAQTDERTPFIILNEILKPLKVKAKPAYTNDFTIRREAIANPLSRIIDGRPGMLVSPKCKIARKGLGGGYCYRRKKVSGNEAYHDVPDKGKFSHVVDSGGYTNLDMGEGRLLMGIINSHKPKPRTVSEIVRDRVMVGEM